MLHSLPDSETEQFRSDLLGWFSGNQRDLPWRRTRDPYAIWISEVMLQQTRVSAALSYYERFLARFPDFHTLAIAAESDLLAYWAGLGYYHRARNLQKAAQSMHRAGNFPATYNELRKLPGIGDYTAAAIASIAFQQAHSVLDGNVLRVLSRIFNDSTNIASHAGRKHFAVLAGNLLDRSEPGMFNQALMELGATICLPRNPQCLLCPVRAMCRAVQQSCQNELPTTTKPSKSVREKRDLFWIEHDSKILAWRRPATSRLMPGFWELPERAQLRGEIAGRKLGVFRHTITFHKYLFEVISVTLLSTLNPNEIFMPSHGECSWISLQALDHIAVSTILRKASCVVNGARPKGAAKRATLSY